ncbi:uncharacterized protein LOC135684007 isoform X1 [Rhopilema esculentum]|uniref:uncharacterized protein LOC135684007 isoform X1 n=1 Tax=Rhopilema esculentum TaxID=499914 RepID=UPI0031DC9B3F
MTSFINAIPSSEGQGEDFKRIFCSIPCTIENASDYLHQKLFPRKFCKDTWQVPEEDFDKALKKTEHAIETIWKNALSMPLDDTDARYAKISATLKNVAPPLRLVWWRTLDHLGKTPKSNEGYTLTLEEALNVCQATGKVFTYYFLSHRWDTRDHPDPNGVKSRICADYSRVRTQTFNEEVFYWIDYSSIDQEGMAPFIAALPLYCSGAQIIMVPYNEEYEDRGWCLVERLAYAALNGPLQFVCGMKYVDHAQQKGWSQIQSCFTYFADSEGLHYSWLRPLANPALGKLSFEQDRPLIKSLSEVLLRQWGKTWVQGSRWPPPGAFDRCSTTAKGPVRWGVTTVNVILMSKT